jgi:hypothetical protein
MGALACSSGGARLFSRSDTSNSGGDTVNSAHAMGLVAALASMGGPAASNSRGDTRTIAMRHDPNGGSLYWYYRAEQSLTFFNVIRSSKLMFLVGDFYHQPIQVFLQIAVLK